MELIILQDGLYSLVPVAKTMAADLKLFAETNCFQLCDILRIKLSTYAEYPLRAHIMNDGSGEFIGCICR